MRIKVSVLIIGIILTVLGSQELIGQGKAPFVVPSSVIDVIAVSDSKCPIQISGPFSVIGYPNGGLALQYTITNISDANVKSYEVEELNWFDSNGYRVPAEVNQGKFVFAPGQKVPAREEVQTRLTPYNPAIATESGMLSDANRIWLVAVTKVRLSNGITYDGTKSYQRLVQFIDALNLGSHPTADKLKNAESKLREFILKTR